jgi:uncharacterized protein YhhL (DUF1145 family)
MPGNNTGHVPPPAPLNLIRPWKRPLSSMTPTIVLKVCCFVISFAHVIQTLILDSKLYMNYCYVYI